MPSRFNQMAEALAKVKLNAEDLPDASTRLIVSHSTTGLDESMRADRSAIRGSESVQQSNLSDVQKSIRSSARDKISSGVIVGESNRDIDWMKLGDATQVSLCPTSFWDEEIAKMRAVILKKTFIRESRDRILLLGTRVAKIWLVGGRSRFGLCTLLVDDVRLNVAWIPHPRKLTEYTEQLEATTYIEWVCGERKMP